MIEYVRWGLKLLLELGGFAIPYRYSIVVHRPGYKHQTKRDFLGIADRRYLIPTSEFNTCLRRAP
jgi:hypothetical protein